MFDTLFASFLAVVFLVLFWFLLPAGLASAVLYSALLLITILAVYNRWENYFNGW